MRLLVTGIAALIGSHGSSRAGTRPRARDPRPLLRPAGEGGQPLRRAPAPVIEGDVLDAALLDSDSSARFDAAAHGGRGPSVRAPARYQRVNVEPPRRHPDGLRLELVRAPVSTKVPFDEEDSGPRFRRAHAASKRAAELALRAAHTSGIDVALLLLHRAGPRQRPDTAHPRVLPPIGRARPAPAAAPAAHPTPGTVAAIQRITCYPHLQPGRLPRDAVEEPAQARRSARRRGGAGTAEMRGDVHTRWPASRGRTPSSATTPRSASARACAASWPGNRLPPVTPIWCSNPAPGRRVWFGHRRHDLAVPLRWHVQGHPRWLPRSARARRRPPTAVHRVDGRRLRRRDRGRASRRRARRTAFEGVGGAKSTRSGGAARRAAGRGRGGARPQGFQHPRPLAERLVKEGSPSTPSTCAGTAGRRAWAGRLRGLPGRFRRVREREPGAWCCSSATGMGGAIAMLYTITRKPELNGLASYGGARGRRVGRGLVGGPRFIAALQPNAGFDLDLRLLCYSRRWWPHARRGLLGGIAAIQERMEEINAAAALVRHGAADKGDAAGGVQDSSARALRRQDGQALPRSTTTCSSRRVDGPSRAAAAPPAASPPAAPPAAASPAAAPAAPPATSPPCPPRRRLLRLPCPRRRGRAREPPGGDRSSTPAPAPPRSSSGSRWASARRGRRSPRRARPRRTPPAKDAATKTNLDTAKLLFRHVARQHLLVHLEGLVSAGAAPGRWRR